MNRIKRPVEVAARENLDKLSKNTYPGRMLVVGLDDSEKYLIQLYGIMGRSLNSRNRVFTCGENGLLFTEAADPSQVKDSSLIIYNAMREVRYPNTVFAIVSNGSQTDGVADGYASGQNMHSSLQGYVYEPDKPNFTPRITAVSGWASVQTIPFFQMSLLRKSPWNKACDRHLYEFGNIGRGFGHCITTYSGDGDPLPAFQGEPYVLPLYGDENFIAGTYWDALNADNRVSLAVKFIPKDGSPSRTVIKNKYKKGPFPTFA